MTIRLRVMSDLHREFERPDRPGRAEEIVDGDGDLVILAGDTDTRRRGPRWALSRFARPIIMIGGNHEAYGDHLFANIGAHRNIAQTAGLLPDGRPHLVYLEREQQVISTPNGQVRLLGATLWTDFCLFGPERQGGIMEQALAKMDDYRQIKVRSRDWDACARPRLTPAMTLNIHEMTVAWLAEALAIPFDGPSVVITHHAPSFRSIPPWLQDDPISACYASRLDELIERTQPDCWIHGHIHESQDYRIGNTRVVCNPRGYVDGLSNRHFKPDLVIAV